MLGLFSKIFSAQKNILRAQPLPNTEVFSTGHALQEKVGKLFKGSLAIRVVTAGSDNSYEQELIALGNAYYDVDRFGVHFVASPRHADMLFVTGPVSRNMSDALLKTYEAMPSPKLVIAIGDEAIDGGIFKGSYGVLDGAHNVVPVDYSIPGNPPSPQTLLNSLVAILNDLEAKGYSKTNS